MTGLLVAGVCLETDGVFTALLSKDSVQVSKVLGNYLLIAREGRAFTVAK